MTTDEDIMKEMLDRATSPAKEARDLMGMQMFYMIVRSNPQLVPKAQELLLNKIRSQNVAESIKAIALLEESMSECGPELQDELAKFRFLNDLIRLVSTKYEGNSTAAAVKKRIMECLLLWTTQFPQKNKIREVYEMLSKEGGAVEHGNAEGVVANALAMPKRENILGSDEKVLADLIRSGDTENYKRANLLIQHRVNQLARRNELMTQHKSELKGVQNTIELLNQMLDAYENESKTAVSSSACEDSVNVIRELYMNCKKHKSVLQNIPELLGNVDEELIADTFETNDSLQAVMKRYKALIVYPQKMANLVGAGAPTSTTTNTDLLKNLLDDVLTPSEQLAKDGEGVKSSNGLDLLEIGPQPTKTAEATTINNTLEELNEILGGPTPAAPFGTFDLLEPVSVAPKPLPGTEEDKPLSEAEALQAKQLGFKELRDIDMLSEQLFRQNLSDKKRIGSFKRERERLTLNDLVKERSTTKVSPHSVKDEGSPGTAKLPSGNSNEQHNDEVMLGNESTSPKQEATNLVAVEEQQPQQQPFNIPAQHSSTEAVAPIRTSKPLSEVTIDLDDVTPLPEGERILIDDDDIKVTLNFTTNRPSPEVSVIVLSVMNKSSMPINDFHFEASVKKPSKVRLLPPTATNMAGFKPFRPPTPINQIMLLLNPTRQAVDVSCIVGYQLGDDPDPFKECILANNIPYVE